MKPPIVTQLSSTFFYVDIFNNHDSIIFSSYDPVGKFLGTSLTLTGTIVHGYGVFIYIGDEGMPTGANWTIEVAT